MKCPNCTTQMNPYLHSPNTSPTSTTTWLCPRCCKRVSERAKNPRYLVAPGAAVSLT